MYLDASHVICFFLPYVGTLAIVEGGLRPPSFSMSLLAGALSCRWMLLLSFIDTIVVLEGAPRPPEILMSLFVALSCLLDASQAIC